MKINRGEVSLMVGHSTDIYTPGVPRQRHQVRRLSTDNLGLEKPVLPNAMLQSLISSARVLEPLQ